MMQIIPASMLTPAKLDTFLAWLRGLRIDPEDKKQLLSHWCDTVGLPLTGNMVKTAEIE